MPDQQFTNRLANETSPYLLQHAHNPVDWYPWGPEALGRARTQDKPILLSIGYSACHWCHVMEHESFENTEIATLMNEHFVCIKVDREERPDIDSIYMNAVQLMTQHGGWPLTVFLTPDLKPFYGGTYFPPVDRHNMPAFPRILLGVADAYENRRQEILTSANTLTAELNNLNRFRSSDDMLTPHTLDQAYSAMANNVDRTNGGFGHEPKFPPSMNLMFMLRQHNRTKSSNALDVVELTLDKMAAGGIYDHIGGGFHRYSVDAQWLVPHFEKMLYDNALLTRVYMQAYQLTNKPAYKQVAEETLEYVMRDMTDRSGGFYSSEDADSEGEEGKFYTWSREEIHGLLAAEERELFCDYYNVTSRGNFEHGRTILNTTASLERFAEQKQIKAAELKKILAVAKNRLFTARERRVRPGRDDKILTAWNGLMLTAFAEAACVLGRDDYRLVAVKNADFILTQLMKDGRLLRTYKNGQAKLMGYIEDYAYVIEGLIALYEATFDHSYLERARALAETTIGQFWDDSESGFFFTSIDHEELITRTKDYFDNAIPSGNSVAALALLKLALLTNMPEIQRPALGILRATQQAMSRYPAAFGYLLCALDFYLSDVKEVAIIGQPESHEVRSLLEQIYSRFLPNKVVAVSESGDSSASDTIALLKDKTAVGGKATAYVCRNYACQAPVTTPEELAAQIAD